MKNDHKHDENCTHCACDNPLFKKYAKEVFNSEFKKAFTELMKKNSDIEPPSLSIVYYTNKLHDRNSAIYTMKEGKLNPKEAMGVHAGKIIAFGTLEEVRGIVKLAHPESTLSEIELKDDETIVPGFVEPHVHIVSSFLIDDWISLSGIEDQKLLHTYNIEYLKKNIRIPDNPNYWILAKEVDPALMYGSEDGDKHGHLITLDLDKLDSINKEKPLVFLSSSAHTFYANTIASIAVYERCINNKDVKEFKEAFKLKDNSTIVDFLKETKGQFQEVDQMKWVYKTIPTEQITTDKPKEVLDKMVTYLTNFFDKASSHGFTYMNDASFSEEQLEILSLFLEENKIMKVSGAMTVENVDGAIALGEYTPYINGKYNVRISAAKLVSDGSNQGLTGYQEVDYCPNANATFPKGLFNYTNPPLTEDGNKPNYRKLAKELVENNWPLMIHANGDAAVAYTLDVMKKALDENNYEIGTTHLINRIEHCSIMPANTESCFQTMTDYNIQPSFLIGHVGYWGYVFKGPIFGPDKVKRLDMCASMIKKEIPISLHSDYPVTPLGALRMMEQAITRVMEGDPNVKAPIDNNWTCENLDDYRLNGDEKICPEEALAAVTYNAARQCGAEEGVGTLTVDTAADFVILKENPIKMNATTAFMKMRYIEVLETWVNGTQTHPKKQK
jgi:predicted amidohydrolase YtcJ